MRPAAVIIIIGTLALPVRAQPGLAPEVLLLSRIRRHATDDLSHLPNFTCLETIERSTRNSPLKPFDVRDVVRVEVAYVGTHELFAWPGASNFESRTLGDMIGVGMTSSGEYIGHARSVFVGSMAVIHYVGEEDTGGHHAAHYSYEISPAFSGYEVNANGTKGVVGTRGSFWADTTTYDLLRLTLEGFDIPFQLGIRAILTSIDYGRLRIASGTYLLPQSAVIWMGHESGLENRNRIEFTHCRQYATESVLSFDSVEDPSVPRSQPPPIEFTLPAGLTISLHLETPIRKAGAKVGDAISATLSADLKQNGELLAPRGATVSGRLRILRKDRDGYTVGLEFTDLTFENQHARFIAKLVSARTVATDPEPDLPGVATFIITHDAAELPQGMPMVWRTGTLSK